MTRRDFLKLLGAGIVLSGCGVIFTPHVKQMAQQVIQTAKAIAFRYKIANSTDVFNLHQVITSDITTSRTIMWQSALDEQDAIMEYRIKGIADTTVVKTTNEEFTDDHVKSYIHSATITNLQPRTVYEYRVGCGEKRSDWHDLSTN